MNTTTLESKSPNSMKVDVDLAKTKNLLLRTASILQKISDTHLQWILQARGMALIPYMHEQHEEIPDLSKILEGMGMFFFESMKDSAVFMDADNLSTELQKEVERLSGISSGS